jgi:hypothetical protein
MVGSVDHHRIFIRLQPIHDDVVHAPTLIVRKKRILAGTVGQLANVVRGDVLQILEDALALQS